MNNLHKAKSSINGVGLFSNTSYQKHDLIAYIDGPVVVCRGITCNMSKNAPNWIGVGRYSWINTDQSLFRYINHSCNPNTALVTKRKVIALRTIAANEELTMDYSLTEAEPSWSVENCQCGADSCRNTIGPIMHLPEKTFTHYQAYIPKNFQKIYAAANNQ